MLHDYPFGLQLSKKTYKKLSKTRAAMSAKFGLILHGSHQKTTNLCEKVVFHAPVAANAQRQSVANEAPQHFGV
ncbi:hypothetical protein [Ascidiaceihabitans donghaensis]|uniref:hypothetical protein n=1 Tax=Ascidiaceihabitans donghaensis TaxID=1510460 RepID=UPI000D54CBDB|nr:hypothetical protein [Ascidiaceihabitans donghaensis]